MSNDNYTQANEYIQVITDKLLDNVWTDEKFNKEAGFREPTDEERALLESHKDKEVIIASIVNGKRQVYKEVLKEVEECGLSYGEEYTPFSGAQRAGILLVLSDDLEPIYSCKEL